MPATDGLQPAGLSQGAKVTVKSYGGWTNTMQSYGLKAHDDNDAAEGKAIVEALGKNDEAEAQAETSTNNDNSKED